MKNILQLAIVFVFITIFNIGIFPSIVSADTEIFGHIEQDDIWTAEGSPYIVHGDVYVDSGVRLSVDEGVIVKFDTGSSLMVLGSLELLGTSSDKIYLTSISDDSVGGDTNLDEDATIPNVGDWRFILFDVGSVSGILNNVVSRYSDDGLVIFDAYLSIENFDSDKNVYFFNSNDSVISGLTASNIYFFDNSGATISNSFIHNSNDGQAVSLYENSNVDISNTEIRCSYSCDNVIGIYDSSVLSICDSDIHSDSEGIFSFDSMLNIDNANIDNYENGISLYDSSLSLSNSIIINSQSFALGVYNYSSKSISILNNEIKNNRIGVASYGEVFSMHNNSIHTNTAGVINYATYMGDLDMNSNWWGSKTGPYHETLNIYGLGNSASDGVSYYPWLPYDPLNSEMSNVLFIPGFQGSRMYRQKSLPIIGAIEDKLWEPNTNSDITDMMMDNFGVSLNESIYTRDIVDKKSALLFSSDIIYESFMSDMDDLVSSYAMSAWATAPYDWRYDPMYVVDHGSVDADGNIFYENNLLDTEDSYIVKKVGELISNSKSGRVTLVAHSNGGLVLKALMIKLEQMKTDSKNDYIDYIDKVVMVATPQVGTPKAVASILHGYDQELYAGVILKQSVARNFGLRLPGAYSLLPTSKYFYNVVDSPIVFDQSLNKINNFYKIFGEKISNYEDFKDFLLAKKKDRTTPTISNLEAPAILFPGIFNDSVDIHEQLDNYTFPSKTKVYQLAGWGLPTLKAVRYFTRNDCIPVTIFGKKCKLQYNLDVEPVFTDDGDETVVTPSANFINNANSYYLNLFKYNGDLNLKDEVAFDHARVFDILYTREWIKNILKKSNVLPSYITKSKPTEKKNLVLYIHTTPGVDKNVSVTDKDGNKMGVKLGIPSDPETADFIPYIQSITGGYYSRMGSNHYIYLSYSGSESYKVDILPTENTGSNTSSGSVIIRQDVVNGDVIESSVTVPSIPISDGTTVSTETGSGGMIGEVVVDDEGDGVVDHTVPSIPTEDPLSPVQEDDNINLEIVEEVLTHKISGSYSIPQLKIDNSDKLETEINIDNSREVVIQKTEINTSIDTEGQSSEVLDKDTKIVLEDIDTATNLTASATNSNIEISWMDIFNAILTSIIISFVLYKFIYKVK